MCNFVLGILLCLRLANPQAFSVFSTGKYIDIFLFTIFAAIVELFSVMETAVMLQIGFLLLRKFMIKQDTAFYYMIIGDTVKVKVLPVKKILMKI